MAIRDTYRDWKDAVYGAYLFYEEDNRPAENCRNIVEGQANEYGNGINGVEVFLFVLAVAEREIRLGILEEKVLDIASYHIYRYENMDRYRADLMPEEIEEVEKDIAYIKSKVELPELESYDDSIMENNASDDDYDDDDYDDEWDN